MAGTGGVGGTGGPGETNPDGSSSANGVNGTAGTAGIPTAPQASCAASAQDVSISSGNPVPEPASGSVPATFTITLPAPQSAATTVDYDTVDGTATAAANDYTAVPNGSVVIPAGETTAQVQVQVDDGSGQTTTETKGFSVQLTSDSAGLPIGSPAGSAPQTITSPGVGGTVTDDAGNLQAGEQLTLTGTAASGQPVTQQTTTGASGMYQLYADPGTYTISPAPPAQARGNPMYVASSCPGTAKSGACTAIPLVPSASLTANFKVIALIVNSTLTTENAQQAALGVCDVTPSAASETCTLPQAIDVSNELGGRTIGFDVPGGGVPVITVSVDAPGATSSPLFPQPPHEGQPGLPALTAPAVIDGTTQPAAGRAEVLNSPNSGGFSSAPGLEVAAGGAGSTIRGLDVAGFMQQLALEGESDTIQNDYLGTDPSGTAPGGAPPYSGSPREGLWIASSGNQIGGTASGQGVVISGNDAGNNAAFDAPGDGVYVRLAATIAAHDGARHAHHKSRTTRLTLRHTPKDG